jgi:hypothetical protein
LKRGELTAEKIALAMKEPVTVEYRGNHYSFIDFQPLGAPATAYYAKLAKYKPQGAVEVVKEEQHASAEAEIRNLIEAASPFVYLPVFSGLAYRHIWNIFTREQFERVFKELVEAKFERFFVGCDIEPVTDLRTFVMRLSRLDLITELKARVAPPNPLFGPCWKSLGEYMRKRRLDEAEIREQAEVGINTRIKEIASAVLADESAEDLPTLMEPLLDGVGDAALLMAADGYGQAKVTGIEEKRTVIVRTSENQKSFMFDGDPNPALLFEHVEAIFRKLSEERGLDHR